MSDEELKIWIVVRTDLPMSIGKIVAQVGHAVEGLAFATPMAGDRVRRRVSYMDDAGRAKIAVGASGAVFVRAMRECEIAGMPFYVVRDAGRTEVEPGSLTVLAFGPAKRAELPSYLKRLQLLKEDA